MKKVTYKTDVLLLSLFAMNAVFSFINEAYYLLTVQLLITGWLTYKILTTKKQ